jgi:hypothetical protein
VKLGLSVCGKKEFEKRLLRRIFGPMIGKCQEAGEVS